METIVWEWNDLINLYERKLYTNGHCEIAHRGKEKNFCAEIWVKMHRPSSNANAPKSEIIYEKACIFFCRLIFTRCHRNEATVAKYGIFLYKGYLPNQTTNSFSFCQFSIQMVLSFAVSLSGNCKKKTVTKINKKKTTLKNILFRCEMAVSQQCVKKARKKIGKLEIRSYLDLL